MKRRMNNIFCSDGRAFLLALDHAAMMPSPDLHDAGCVICEAVSGGADGGISSLLKHMERDVLYSAEDAVRVGADAMLCMGYPGSTDNEHSLKYLAKLCAAGEKFGLPIGAEMLPFGFEKHEGIDTRSIDNIKFACRQGAELGADFIKTEFVGKDDFIGVTESCFAPILVLGGSKAKSEEEIFLDIKSALEAGAKGIIMGRNIYRHSNIARFCEAISIVIHDDASVAEALSILK